MTDRLAECAWPPLPERYEQALRQAVGFILDRFDPLGIIASGSIVRGAPHPTSDLDMYVIHAQPWRQRLQQVFDGVPAEIFVNPPRQIESYFKSEQAEGRPITAHMLATGFVIFACDPIVEALRERARTQLNTPPTLTTEQTTFQRYLIASRLEDALDVAPTDSTTTTMLLGLTVHELLQFRFLMAGRHIPRDKDLIGALDDLDPQVASMARQFYETSSLDERIRLVTLLADQIIGARGFFAWESSPEEV